MTLRHRSHRLALLFIVVVAMAACAKKPPAPPPPPPPGPPPAAAKPEPLTVTLRAAADVNPDSNGRPSPVVVRIYQLKSDAAFTGADFFGLYDDEGKALGQDLIGKSVEVTLRPGENAAVPDFFVDAYAHFVGVIAAYRDIRNAQWRLVIPRPVPRSLAVSVGKLRLELLAK